MLTTIVHLDIDNILYRVIQFHAEESKVSGSTFQVHGSGLRLLDSVRLCMV